MTLVSGYNVELEFPCSPDRDQGVDTLPRPLLSGKSEGSFIARKATQDDKIPFSNACLTPSPSFFDSEPYSLSNRSRAGPLLGVFYSEEMSLVTVDPTVLTGPTPRSSLPPSSTSSRCTAQDPTLTPPSEGKHRPTPTSRHIRPRHSRQANVVVESHVEESHGKDEDDEYEQKRETHSLKRSRRVLVTPEQVSSDTSSAFPAPPTLSTPISSKISPRPARSLPRCIVRKEIPETDDQRLDSDADDPEFEGECKKAYKARGSGTFVCSFQNCDVRFQRDPERKRHYKLKHSKDDVSQSCEHCLKSFSRRDAVWRHYNTCEVLHLERCMPKRKGGVLGKAKTAKKATLK